MAVFFNLLFPVLLLLVMGPIFGNEATSAFNGYGSIDVFLSGFVAIMIGSYSLVGLPLTLASYREQGVLKRFRAAPISPAMVLGAQAAVCLLVVGCGTAMLLGTAVVLFPIRPPAAPLHLVPALFGATLSFSTLGFVLGSVLRTTRAAQAVGNALFFPMLFLSGAAMPRLLFPDWMQQIGAAIPLTYVVTLLQDLWIGHGWNGPALLVLGALLVAGSSVATVLFRWS
jgi:ABC-2 type transport system permease protein